MVETEREVTRSTTNDMCTLRSKHEKALILMEQSIRQAYKLEREASQARDEMEIVKDCLAVFLPNYKEYWKTNSLCAKLGAYLPLTKPEELPYYREMELQMERYSDEAFLVQDLERIESCLKSKTRSELAHLHEK